MPLALRMDAALLEISWATDVTAVDELFDVVVDEVELAADALLDALEALVEAAVGVVGVKLSLLLPNPRATASVPLP
jgi:hypothetical protein